MLNKNDEIPFEAEKIGSVIKSCRTEKKLSQEVLSGLSGIARTNYSSIERGTRKPTVPELKKIADALNMSAETLLKKIEDTE